MPTSSPVVAQLRRGARLKYPLAFAAKSIISRASQGKGTTMTDILRWARAFTLLAVMAALSGEAAAAAKAQAFDGSWSILIVTQAGDCDRAYRYAVQIEDGQIVYDGSAGVEFTGRVDRNGRVSATLQRGEQSATGTGRLSGNRGTGTWQGRTQISQCSGYWEAERR